MRYVKILLLALFIFFAVLFFIQNQAPLSQEMTLSLNLFFMPVLTSIPLPFYFIVVAAFCIGCLLAVLWFMWDKFNTSAKLVRGRWRITSLEKEITTLKKQVDQLQNLHSGPPALPEAPAEEKSA